MIILRQREFGVIRDTYNQLMRDHKVKGIKKDLKAAKEDFRLGNLDVARRYKFDLENFGKEPAILQQKVGKQLIKDRYADRRNSILNKAKTIGVKYKKPTK